MEPHLDPCSETHYLAPWSVLEPLLIFMRNCTNFKHSIEQLYLEHVCKDQLDHIDKSKYMLL